MGTLQIAVRRCSRSTPHPRGSDPGRPIKQCGARHGHGGHRSISSSTPHIIGIGPGRPAKSHGPPRGAGEAAQIQTTSRGPRSCPAHLISSRWTAARSGPSNSQSVIRVPPWSIKHSQTMAHGPGWPIQMLEDGSRPHPELIIFTKFRGPVRPGPSLLQKSRNGPARPGPSGSNGPWQALANAMFINTEGVEPDTFHRKNTNKNHHGYLIIGTCNFLRPPANPHERLKNMIHS